MKLIKPWLFFDVIKLFRKKPKPILYMLLFDSLFIITGYYMNILFNIVKFSGYYAYLAVQAIYLLLFMFGYSLFKYCIMHTLSSFTHERMFSLRQLLRFYCLNLLLLIISAVVFYLIELAYSAIIRPDASKNIALVLFFVYVAIAYIAVNLSHSYFILGNGIKGSLRKTAGALRRVGLYIGVLIMPTLMLMLYFLTYSVITFSARSIYKNPTDLFLSGYFGFFTVITFIILYLIILSNRLYFYLIAGKS